MLLSAVAPEEREERVWSRHLGGCGCVVGMEVVMLEMFMSGLPKLTSELMIPVLGS